MDIFRVRLNCVDYYQATPSGFDPPLPRDSDNGNGKTRPRVSVIRVFGATETGQKVLLHVHGAFQYCYIEYTGSLADEEVKVAIRTLHLSIDQALAVSYRKNLYDGKHAYVAHIALVKGIPFYGFHVGYKFYLKIYLLNPLHMTRLADLLREGTVMKRVLQPYESHMQYLAQWMCDYNLYGCAYINCAKVKFRGPLPDPQELNTQVHKWHDDSIPRENVSNQECLPKQSHCSLEVDLCVEDILNREDVHMRPIHHDFTERIHPLPSDTKFVQSMAGLWKDETRRRKAKLGITEPDSSPFPPEALMTMSADPRNTQAGGWIHEQEYRDKVDRIAREEHESSGRKMDFGDFVRKVPYEDAVRTALESVEDLYPKNLPRGMQVCVNEDTMDASVPALHGAVIDEARIAEIREAAISSDHEAVVHANHGGSFPSRLPLLEDPDDSLKLDIMSSITSREYAELGVRKVGDSNHPEDDFIVPDEFLIRETQFRQHKKQPPEGQAPPMERIRKRHKQLVDEKHILPDFDSLLPVRVTDPATIASLHLIESLEEQLASSVFPRRNSQQLAGSQKNVSQPERTLREFKLTFPVVKDANGPSTIARLSQQSGSSVKSMQGPRRKSAVSVSNSQHTSSKMSTLSGQASQDVFPLLGSVPQGIAMQNAEGKILVFSQACPSFSEVESSMGNEEIPMAIYQSAYYSDEADVPDRQREYAGREFKLESNTEPFLPEFDLGGVSVATFGRRPPLIVEYDSEKKADGKRRRLCKMPSWNIAELPPSRKEVERWLEEEAQTGKTCTIERNTTGSVHRVLSQIDGPTQKNKNGFKYSQKQKSTSVQHETQYMSIMSLEVHANSRGNLAPNPEQDEVTCVFWCVQSDDADFETDGLKENTRTGVLVNDGGGLIAMRLSSAMSVEVEAEASELDLLTHVTDIVRMYDPDILTGYEVHNSSWGYLIERARLKYELNLCDEMSRMKSQSHGRFGKEEDRWGFNQSSTIRITGRHTINIWRAMRGELNLLQYTMENVVFHLLHRRVPHYKFSDLTAWFRSNSPRDLSKVIEYFVSRVRMDLEILESNELVPRTSEQARLLGIDWFSVISRGSQFKVESLMFRIAKPENFIVVSPSRRQVGGQNALECLPLVMEPQSDFYTSPLLVLDFQSLYPSVMIAYNYCYSTFLGRVVGWRGTNKMGFTDYQRESRLIDLLKDHINIAPNGIMYAKPHIRKSLLAKMLAEILETRVMVKSGMKVDKDDKTLQRLLNNRQLALKLIANVTYGYTSASFSGRMPCSEIADSIVQTGRETLEKTIAFIHSVEKWGAEVVYGDTDSLFVYLKGRTREQAFDIGEEIVTKVTKMNPRPIKLKFEKVYHPCVLLAKKRYVGFKYEYRNQKEPDFDAKGIETVRRDGTPAEQKIEERALKILFKTADLSKVKSFFQSQCDKIMRGRVSIQDFCFAREVKLGTYSDKGPPPPGALISARKMIEDPRLEPQYGERVPYIVITGGPGARLIDRCVAPEVLLHDAQLELDAEYYISKNLIPPLERIFNLVGANVRQWYDEMPKYQRIRRIEGVTLDLNDRTRDALLAGAGGGAVTKKTLESYMKSSTCIVCRDALLVSTSGVPTSTLCANCQAETSHTAFLLRTKLAKAERKSENMHTICQSCSGISWAEPVRCDSKDCPVFYSRVRQNADLASTKARLVPVLRELEDGLEEIEGKAIEW